MKFFFKDLSKLESRCLCEKVCGKRHLETHNSFLSDISLHFFHLKKKKWIWWRQRHKLPQRWEMIFQYSSGQKKLNHLKICQILATPSGKKTSQKRAAEPSLPIALLVSCGNAQMTMTTWRLAAANEKRHNRVTAAIDLQSAWRRPHPATHTHRVWTEWQCRGRVRGIHYSAAGLFLATPSDFGIIY